MDTLPPALPTNKSVQDYRAWKEAKDGRRDSRPDLLLTLELGDLMRSRKDSSIEDSDPEFRQQYLELSQSTDRGLLGEVGAGLSRGARGLASTATGAAALGLDAIGFDESAKALVKKGKEIEEGGEDNAPTVQKLGDVQDGGGAVRYAAGKVGEAIPSIGEAILLSVIGGAAGTAAAPGVGTLTGGAAGLLGRQTMKSLIRKGAAGLTEKATEAEVRAMLAAGTNTALQAAFKKEAGALAARAGAAAAGGVNSLALSSGEIYNDTENVGLSLGAGAVAAVPDTILPAYIAGKFFKGAVTKKMEDEAGGFVKRLAKEAAKTMPIETGTEAFQELVGIAAGKYNRGEPAKLTDDDLTRLTEAAVGGLAGGLVAAPVAAAPSPQRDVTQEPKNPAEDPRMAARRRAAERAGEGETFGPPPPPAPKTRGEWVRDLRKLDAEAQDARINVLAGLTKRSDAEVNELEVLQALAGQRPKTEAQTAPPPAAPAAAVVPPPVAPVPPAAPTATEVAPVVAAPLATPAAAATPPAAPKPPTVDEVLAANTARAGKVGSRISKVKARVPSLDVSEAIAKLKAMTDSGAVNDEALTAIETAVTELEAKVPVEASKRALKQAEVALLKAQNVIAKEATRAEAERKTAMKLAEKAAKKISAPYGDLPEDRLVNLSVRGTTGEVGPWEAPARKAALVVGAQLDKLTVVLGKLKTEPLSAALKKQVKPDVIKFFEAEQAKLVTQGVEGKRASEMVIEQAITEANGYLNEIYAQAGVTRPIPEPVIAANQIATLDNESPSFRPEPEVVTPPPAPVPKPIVPPLPVTPAPPPLTALATQLDAALNPAASAAPAAPRTKGFSFGKITGSSKAVTSIKELDATGAGNAKQGQKTKIAVALLAPDGKVYLRGLFNNRAATNGTALVGTKGTGKGLVIQDMGVLKSKAKGEPKLKQVSATGKMPVLAPDLVAAGYKLIAQINFDLTTLPERISEDFANRADFDAAWGLTEKVANREGDKNEKAAAEAAAIVAPEGANVKDPKSKEGKLLREVAILQAKLNNNDVAPDEVDAVKADIVRKLAAIDKINATNQKARGTQILATVEKPSSEQKPIVDNEPEPNPEVTAGVAATDIKEVNENEAGAAANAQSLASEIIVPTTTSGKLALMFKKNNAVLGEISKRWQANDGKMPSKGKLELLMSYIRKNISDPLEIADPTEVVQHIQNAWNGTPKSGGKVNIIGFEDRLGVDIETDSGVQESRDANRSVPETAQTRAQFDQMINTLRKQGHDIELLKKTFDGEGGQDAWLDRADGKIYLVMNDTAAGNLRNVAAVVHEVGHDIIGKMSRERKAALMRATSNTFSEVRKGKALIPSANSGANLEETIVDTLSIKLAEEGFGSRSATFAAAIWRAVKDLYYRAANAMITSLGGNPGDAFAISWFENQLRRKLGGDYDYRFADLLSPFKESKVERSSRFTRIGGAPVADFLDPFTNRILQGEMLPDTVDAADWNVMHAANDFSVDDPNKDKVNLAPNGKPSKLTNRQWNMVRTPAFKAWFGDWQNDPANASKAIDPETGEPLVMYHGTDSIVENYELDEGAVLKKIGDRSVSNEIYNPLNPNETLVKRGERIDEWSLRKIINAGIEKVEVENASVDGRKPASEWVTIFGEPEVTVPNFESFDKSKFSPYGMKGAGIYTTSSSRVAGGDGTPVGGGYARKRNNSDRDDDDGIGGRVLPLFVNTRNPFVDLPGNSQPIGAVVEALKRMIATGNVRFKDSNGQYIYIDADVAERFVKFNHEQLGDMKKGPFAYITNKLRLDNGRQESELLKYAGFDGLTHTGGLGSVWGFGEPHQVYVAFEPAQVKSTLNLGTFNPSDPRIQFSIDGTPAATPTESDIDYTESEARTTSAAWNEIMPMFAELKKELGGKMNDQQFWARFASGDVPSKILARMDERAPGSSATKIGDANVTDPMAQRARYRAFSIAQAMAGYSRRKAAKITEHANEQGETLIERAKALNKIEREFRDAEAVNAHFNEKLREDIKELAQDLDRGPDTAWKAGKLLGAIRTAEKLDTDQPVPEEYQRVFKTILDSDGTTSLFAKLEAIAKLDLPLDRMTVTDVLDAVRANAAKDPALQSLIGNKPLFLAAASLAQSNAREMSLLQLRVLKDTAQFLAIKAQLDEIREASDERLDQLSKDIKTGQANRGLADRLRGFFLEARREFRSTQRVIQRAEETAAINRRVAERMDAKATELSKDVGAFSNWQMHDGAIYSAMQQGSDGTWKAVPRTLRMTGNEVSGQREQVRHDLALNALWLEANADQKGTRLYNEIKQQTQELGLAGIGEREYRAAHRFILDKVLQPLGQKFASTGRPAGFMIQQMLNRWQFITKTYADEIEAKSRKWTVAFDEAKKAAGYTYAKDFLQDIYDPVIYAIESEPGRDETGALREAVRAARRRLPEGQVLAPNFAEKLSNLMRATKDISERLNAIAEKQGVYIEDARIKDPLTAGENLNRHSIKYGWLTSSRRLRPNVIQTLVTEMTAKGWSKDMFDDLMVDDTAGEMNDAQFRSIVDSYFTDNIKRIFVEPFTGKPGKEVFFGADRGKGERAYVSQLMAREAWEESGGDVLAFIDTLFDKTNQADDRKGLNDYRAAMLQRFAFLYEMESKLAAKTSVVKDDSNPHGPKPHRIMDARTNDLIPPEHFTYDAFDPTSARIALAEIGFHAAFGREGSGLDKAVETLRSDLKTDAQAYEDLKGSEREKRSRAADRGLDYKKIERAYKDSRNVDAWMGQVVAYFGGKNPSGATGDAKTALELLQLNTQLVLNNPKSGLWNVLSIADFPVAFRGLGKSSASAVGFAVGNLTKNTFGSLLESVGINILHASEYAKEIGQVFEGRQTERLPFGVFMADIGKGGSFEDSKGERVTQGIRYAQQLMRKGFKLGKGPGEFTGNNALWAPFNYINTQVSSAIAAANVQTFEIMVKKMVDYYAANPEAYGDPAFKFTAEQLGMKGGGFFSDQGAFDFYRRAALDYRLGNIEELARGAAQRMAKGERILTKDQVIGIALMANNEISLESSINSRSAEMFNNPVLRFGGQLMGWPLSKVNAVNQSLKTSDGRLETMAVLKGLGVMAAWSLPMGLAYSLLMDRYDEEILNKKSNIRAIDPIAAVPLVGPALALMGVGGDRGLANAFGMLERTAKAGTYGMLGDAVNSMANVVDPTASQRDFDLNSRVLAYSQYANLRDIVRNLIHTDGAVTYSTVTRPLVTTMGGGGLLQYQQIFNNALGMGNAEAAVTNRINVGSHLRAAGREAGIELKMGAGRVSPTPTSVWVREMQLAALSNDRLGFLEAYRNAVEVARKEGEPDPEGKILEAWKGRDPVKSIFARVPTELEREKLMAAMNEDGRRAVTEAEELFARYTESIEPTIFEKMISRSVKAQQRAAAPFDPIKLRRQMAMQGMGY